MTELPAGWEWARLADVAEVRLGRQRSPKRATGDRMRPYLRAANVTWNGLDLLDVKEMDFTAIESGTYELRPGDLLLSEASGSPGEVGKSAQYKGEIEGCCFQNTLLRVRLPVGLVPDFFEYFFSEQALDGRFAADSRGVGIHHLGASALSVWQVPVPPLAEQQRIVAAIEEAFSKLDAGEAGLRTVRRLLKRMRGAILAAAVTGRLVPQDPTDTSAAKLLADIGVDPMEPRGHRADTPSTWACAQMGDLAAVVSGKTPKGLAESLVCDGEVPFLKVGDLTQADRVLFGSRTWLRTADARRLAVRLHPAGTILFPKRGGAIATNRKRILGCEAAFDLNTMGLVPKEGMTDWIWLWTSQLDLRTISDGSNVPQINHTDVVPLPVPVPPPEEQSRIVTEVERQVSFLDACERAVDAGLSRAAATRRSVLKAAFEGRLLPQDPSDEPASVLLKRIRAERAAAPKAVCRSRTTA